MYRAIAVSLKISHINKLMRPLTLCFVLKFVASPEATFGCSQLTDRDYPLHAILENALDYKTR
jgi:hypothetical protein